MKLVLNLLLLSCIATVSASFNSAMDAYESENYSSAFDDFIEMAEIGESQSQFNLGVMYFLGQYVEKDINKAYAWVKLATQSPSIKKSESRIFNIIKSKVLNMELAESEFDRLSKQYSLDSLLKTLYPEFIEISSNSSFTGIPADGEIFVPDYPQTAARKGLQAWVNLEFDIDKSGYPRNMRVLSSFPENIYTSRFKSTVLSWRFIIAKDESGNAVQRNNVRFNLLYIPFGKEGIVLKKGIFEEYLKNANNGDMESQYNVALLEKKFEITDGKEDHSKWFLKAAIQGHPSAQFEVGRSLVFGQGCVKDRTKGMAWLIKSASFGESNAKQLLSSIASDIHTLKSQKNAISYLKGIKDLNVKTQIDLAWMLATSKHDEISNPKKAIKIIDGLSYRTFYDNITKNEIKAASYAALGDFELAIDFQNKALDEAIDRDVELAVLKEYLSRYKNKKTWFEI